MAFWAAVVPSKVSGGVRQVSQLLQGSQESPRYSRSIWRRQFDASQRPSKAFSFWCSMRFWLSGAFDSSMKLRWIAASLMP